MNNEKYKYIKMSVETLKKINKHWDNHFIGKTKEHDLKYDWIISTLLEILDYHNSKEAKRENENEITKD